MRAMMVVLAVLLALCVAPASASEENNLTVVFFGTEAADAILLYDADSAVLIDTGLKKYGERILAYMQEAGVSSLDLMIVTHFDKDHVGGAEKIIEGIPVNRILAPDYESEEKRYTKFLEAADAASIPIERVKDALSLTVGKIAFDIDAADFTYIQENDLSLVIRAVYGERSFLFAGDAENERLSELLSQGTAGADVLKAPHHGRAERLSEEYLRAVSPAYVVITSSDKEPEDAAYLSLCEMMGAETFLTREGTVILTCDVENIEIRQQAVSDE